MCLEFHSISVRSILLSVASQTVCYNIHIRTRAGDFLNKFLLHAIVINVNPPTKKLICQYLEED